MKKRNILIIITFAALGIWNSCSSDFLEITPNGSLDQTVLMTEKGVDNLLIGAYSLLDGNSDQSALGNSWDGATSGWLYGSIRGLEADKGSDAGDQPEMNPIQTFSETSTNSKLNFKWRATYEGVSRCNATLTTAKAALDAGAITQEQYDNFANQAKVLRGFYHFEAWRFWEKIPYVDETTDPLTVTNTEDVRDKIIADLQAGLNLPTDMGQVGRWNKTVSQVMVAKAMMQMYKDYDGALPILQAALTGTKPNGDPIGLADTYGEIFDIANRNGKEAIYTVQYSVNDGSGAANGGYPEVLNFPYKGNGGSPGGCCGFFQPIQEFVNTFRTAGGLPLPNYTFDTPANMVKNDFGVAVSAAFVEDAGPLDPRLDWSVGRRGIPYWDWGVMTGSDWIRDPNYAGPYSPKKQVFKKSQEGTFTEVGNWTSGWTSNGYRMIRYADVILMIAECQIWKSTPDLEAARTNINLIRARAAKPEGFVKEDDGVTPAANYEISTYDAPFANVDAAKYALMLERKLELGQEGHRYFDLNRWGVTVSELNRAMTYEKTMPWGNALYGSAVVGPEDVTYPVPQRQIDLANGAIVQNR